MIEKSISENSFTLIELLIVVAIIGILAAIAVPNFLESQTRAKVARVKEDLRSLGMAAEMYLLDHGQYPPHLEQPSCNEIPYHRRYAFFTTPVAYIHAIPGREIFTPKDQVNFTEMSEITADTFYYTWTNFASFGCRNEPHPLWPYRATHGYLVRSRGPDGLLEANPVRNAHFEANGSLSPNPFLYHVTNGTLSRG
ncbi:MAG TPA: prepilin-type N-terminal cleavage/methylation domain-containing protein, partial [bacterium]|nr:prepilin-type N-terminal cleavage/methylation domain-containing protein [bacterium]